MRERIPVKLTPRQHAFMRRYVEALPPDQRDAFDAAVRRQLVGPLISDYALGVVLDTTYTQTREAVA